MRCRLPIVNIIQGTAMADGADSNTISNTVMIAVTLAGPILAVQAQKIVESLTAYTRRKEGIFATLLATRGDRVGMSHVNALNAIDMAFYGRRRLRGLGRRYRSAGEAAVLSAWGEYLAHLNMPQEHDAVAAARWEERALQLFTNLLEHIGKDLGYQFDRGQLERGGYLPSAHGRQAQINEALRFNALEVLSGNKTVKMEVVSMPHNPDAHEAIMGMVKAVGDTFDGQRPLPVKMTK